MNVHRDTPCEILHTVLLGEDKYVWHESNKVWDKKKDDQFAVRLASSSIDGLSLPPLRAPYMLQYKNSLVGKHFKALQQLGVFHIHDLCTPDLFNLWKANGALGALLWFPEIKDLDDYLVRSRLLYPFYAEYGSLINEQDQLQIAVDNVLDLWALVDPSRIQKKYKLHVLSHLKDDIRRFGPAILFATEIFESWNAVFRFCSVLSNHQAPSFDIASTMADMERFKHLVSGGWWKSASKGSYVQAGPLARTFLDGNKEIRRRLGLTDGDRPNVPPGKTALPHPLSLVS